MCVRHSCHVRHSVYEVLHQEAKPMWSNQALSKLECAGIWWCDINRLWVPFSFHGNQTGHLVTSHTSQALTWPGRSPNHGYWYVTHKHDSESEGEKVTLVRNIAQLDLPFLFLFWLVETCVLCKHASQCIGSFSYFVTIGCDLLPCYHRKLISFNLTLAWKCSI